MSLAAKKKQTVNVAESKNANTSGLHLSEINVNNTFKNILRNNDGYVKKLKIITIIFNFFKY
jgi:hypothetical protein